MLRRPHAPSPSPPRDTSGTARHRKTPQDRTRTARPGAGSFSSGGCRRRAGRARALACVAKERESARVPEARSNRAESSCATAHACPTSPTCSARPCLRPSTKRTRSRENQAACSWRAAGLRGAEEPLRAPAPPEPGAGPRLDADGRIAHDHLDGRAREPPRELNAEREQRRAERARALLHEGCARAQGGGGRIARLVRRCRRDGAAVGCARLWRAAVGGARVRLHPRAADEQCEPLGALRDGGERDEARDEGDFADLDLHAPAEVRGVGVVLRCGKGGTASVARARRTRPGVRAGRVTKLPSPASIRTSVRRPRVALPTDML
jgi:hypothetical protein